MKTKIKCKLHVDEFVNKNSDGKHIIITPYNAVKRICVCSDDDCLSKGLFKVEVFE